MQTSHWNHNVHYHPLILAAAPSPCRRALDVGCGDGMLARELFSVAEHVVGIDLDRASIETARAYGGEGIEYLHADFFEHAFATASFDLVASVAALHHIEAEAALTRMSRLVRPGGTVVVIGLARSSRLRDLAYDVAGAIATRAHRYILGKRYREHGAPIVWPPPHSYVEMSTIAERILPGVAYRRHVLFRYSLVWRPSLTLGGSASG